MRLWRAVAAALALVGVTPELVAGGSLGAEVDGVRVELSSVPEQPGTARVTDYRVRLSSSDGSGVTGAKVTLQGRMADGMTVVAPLRAESVPGIYSGRVLFTMEGRWDLTLRLAREGKRFELPLIEHVGR